MKRRKQRNIAQDEREIRAAAGLRRPPRERYDLRVGERRIGVFEYLHADLKELLGSAGAGGRDAERVALVEVASRACARGDMGAHRGDGEIRTQARFLAPLALEHEQSLAERLARHVQQLTQRLDGRRVQGSAARLQERRPDRRQGSGRNGRLQSHRLASTICLTPRPSVRARW